MKKIVTTCVLTFLTLTVFAQTRDTVSTSDIVEGKLYKKPNPDSELLSTIPSDSQILISGFVRGTPYLIAEYEDKSGFLSYFQVDFDDMSKSDILTNAIFLFRKLNSDRNSNQSPISEKPKPPYSNPDDIFEFSSGDYKSVTYIYHCLSGNFKTFTFDKTFNSNKWEMVSNSESAGICN